MHDNPAWGYSFHFHQLVADGTKYVTCMDLQILRLFELTDVKFYCHNGTNEDIIHEQIKEKKQIGCGDNPIYIKHFLPTPEAKDRKYKNWYGNGNFRTKQPSEIGIQDGWKEFNPWRFQFDFDEECVDLVPGLRWRLDHPFEDLDRGHVYVAT